LKEVVDEAKATLAPDDLSIANGEFLLGYAYWKSGEMSLADSYMQMGTDAMNVRLSWGHPRVPGGVDTLRKISEREPAD
jgi:hypothetical protein